MEPLVNPLKSNSIASTKLQLFQSTLLSKSSNHSSGKFGDAQAKPATTAPKRGFLLNLDI
ncbi:MAG: hypothetical protein BGO78_08785 [Chloroflexi bacterium 44-23]|nr:MAG: hypothetical protein BGO78_08785 [Chloroflexi bacterium 44-23]